MTGDIKAASVPTCGLCGVVIVGGFLRTGLGEVFCARHRELPGCRLCGAPVAEPGQRHCWGCAVTAVRDQQGVRQVLPRVGAVLRAMGLRLATPVQVKLMSEVEIARHPHRPGGPAVGFTVYRGRDVLDLVILAGLPAVQFGSVVAHECMHAWLAQRGFPQLPPMVAEGLCQVSSYEWLRRSGGDRARLLMTSIEEDPDPVYGAGFRAARYRVQRYGIKAVLAHVRTNAMLPD